MNKLGAIVLAAGKGERLNLSTQNKVTLKLVGKPMIQHGVDFLQKLKIKKIIVVVGFAKESVIELLKDSVEYAVQRDSLGSAHAVSTALEKISEDIENVLVINGDDSAFYSTDLIQELINKHYDSNSEVTFLTIEMDNPNGLGRIIRDENGELLSIVEEKDATEKQKEVKEINPQCFIFKVSFLRKYLSKIEKSKITGEYYLTEIIDVAIKNNEKVETLPAGKILWRGINTKEELEEAEKLFKNKNT
jgi:bifunctional UDP-N-acetylglucosamine pyrophosphorylase / glucosamine-1-phosphate N-acetyltransferase